MLRILKRILLLCLLLGLIILAWTSYHFYYLFPNSHQLFAIRHNCFSHLELHTDRYGYAPQDTVTLCISNSANDSITLSITDIHQVHTLLPEKRLFAPKQSIASTASVEGTAWEPSHRIVIPPDTPPAWYVIKVQSQQQSQYTSIFIRLDSAQMKAPIALLFSTNTWNAYNFWGGQSLYTMNKTPVVSFLRPQPLSNPYLPNTSTNHQIYFQSAHKEKLLVEFLHQHGIAYDTYPISALEQPDKLNGYQLLMLSTHSEYWTHNMVTSLNAYLDQGGSLLSLSGNTAAYISELDLNARTLTVHKSNETLWNEADREGFRPFGTQSHFDVFHTYAPYEVIVDTSWVFEGLEVQKGDVFGEISDTYDYTPTPTHLLFNIFGFAQSDKKGAASGMEIDKVYDKTPANWITIARGKNPFYIGQGQVFPESIPQKEWEGEGGADMGYYRHEGGGLVFNASSLAFTGAIPHDSTIRRILLNVIAHTTESP